MWLTARKCLSCFAMPCGSGKCPSSSPPVHWPREAAFSEAKLYWDWAATLESSLLSSPPPFPTRRTACCTCPTLPMFHGRLAGGAIPLTTDHLTGGGHPRSHSGAVHLLQADGGGVYRQVKDVLKFPLFEVWRNGAAALGEFKKSGNGGTVLPLDPVGKGWTFPGTWYPPSSCPRLPFPVPNPLSQAEQKQFPSLDAYLQEVIVPDMQVKLRQGFGRAHPQRNDTCVVSLWTSGQLRMEDTTEQRWRLFPLCR